jgi:membrane protein required for colicin V production
VYNEWEYLFLEIEVMENLTTLDLGLIAFVILLSLKGFFNGLFKELFGLIGIIGGVFVGTRLGHEAGNYINENFLHLENGSVISVTGFLATLIAFWVVMTLIGNLLSTLTDKSGLGSINKLLGFGFAGIKITLILAVITHALLSIKVVESSAEEYVAGSQVVPQLQEVGAMIINQDFTAMVQKTEETTGLEIQDTLDEIDSKVEKGIE